MTLSNFKRFLKNNFVFVFAAITLLLTVLCKSNPYYTELFYSKGIYPIIAIVLSNLSAVLPFSINDVVITVVLLFLITILFMLLLGKLNFKVGVRYICKTIAIIYILFYWLWGFNYFREPMYKRMNIEPIAVTDSVFNKTYEWVLNMAISNYCDYSGYNKDEIDKELEQSYKELQSFLNIRYSNGQRVKKSMLFSRLIAAASISGYFGPFFSETHMNKLLLPIQHSVILAHEKAHQFGITSEAEASFYAWVVCNECESVQIKYAANLYILRYMLRQSKNKEHYAEMKSQIPNYVIDDLIAMRNFWRAMEIPWINTFQSKMYDLYLKGNNISDGVNNYGGVVKMVCEYQLQKSEK